MSGEAGGEGPTAQDPPAAGRRLILRKDDWNNMGVDYRVGPGTCPRTARKHRLLHRPERSRQVFGCRVDAARGPVQGPGRGLVFDELAERFVLPEPEPGRLP